MKTATPLLVGLVGLSACGQLPTSPGVVQAAHSQPCAKISWQNLGSARGLFSNSTDAGLTRLAYGPARGTQAPSSVEIAEPDQLLRSRQSIDLSAELRREQEKAQVRELEQWLQAHLSVEVRSCPS